MYFKVVKKINYGSKEWREYILWRNYNFEVFESVDGNLNQSLFEPNTDEDWQNVYNEDFKTNFITNLAYAEQVKNKFSNSRVQIFSELSEESEFELLGYDILDGCYSYSLLTNFGNDIEIVNSHLSKIGLYKNLDLVQKVFDWFQSKMVNDNHVKGSHIVKVYAEN